jgi:signal transduction histidine kinase/heme-degrading monooxygenase HmoA
MVVVMSQFRVANGLEADVVRAFRQRPHAVEQAPGFLWLEVFVDAGDRAVFYLVTRWTDMQSYESWHGSPAHRDSHGFIPKGLKLDPAWTKIYRLERLEGTIGPPLTEAVADATLLFGTFAAEAVDIHLFVLDPDGRIQTCNRAACHHLEPDGTLDGRLLSDYMPEPDAARLRALLARPGRHETPERLNFAALNRVPFTLDCWLDVQPPGATLLGQPTFRRDQQLQNELMAINQELAVLSRERSREVRDERYGRQAAEKLNRERNAFLAVLAHELRQPIGSALAAMGVLRKLEPDARLERPRALIERQLKQITRLVDDLADTARVAAGDVELQLSRVDVAHQLRVLATGWEALANDQHKRFVSRIPERAILLRGDVDRLQQVFSNIVNNAFKYTPPEGMVTLSLAVDGEFAAITVEDEGEGIAPDRLPRIFEIFQRATTTGAGLGVGLAVVKALVIAHGGSVTAASEGVGRGATITVRLPLEGTPPSAREPGQS